MTGIHQALMGGGGSPLLYDIIQKLGLGSGLITCLDAADTRSYDGSSQTWTDITGTGNFYRGHTSGATGGDPTFNGTAGLADESTYFSFDGGDFFSDVTTNVPATDDWCNTGAKWTILGLWYLPNITTLGSFFGNRNDGNFNIHLRATTAEKVELVHNRNNAGNTSTETSAASFSIDSWNVIGAAYDNDAPTFDVIINGTSEAVGVSVASTRTADNSSVAENTIGGQYDAIGSPVAPIQSGSRLAAYAMWDGVALTTAQMQSIYTRLKAGRSPSLP